MEITIYSTPKAWRGEFVEIQNNCVKNWKSLKCEVVLLANDPGTKEAAEKYKIKHIPNIKRNNKKTPLVSSIFQAINEDCKTKICAYVNSDVLLFNTFPDAAKACQKHFKEFLMVGRRWNFESKGMEINFKDPNWQKIVRKKMGKAEGMRSRDYFVFNKGLFPKIPEFALGRGEWDSWLTGEALRRSVPVIDASNVIRVGHQNHDFKHIAGVKIKRGTWAPKGSENVQNKKLVKNDHPANPKKNLQPTYELYLDANDMKIRKFRK